MRTVIKITKSFTTVNFTTNDVMDWEFTITNSFTKIVGKKWGFPAIIKEKRKKIVFVVELLATR